MTSERRPRIPEWISDRIDILREGKPFEEFVRDALDRAVGRYWIEKDPQHPKRFRLVGEDENLVAVNLTERDAKYLAADLALADQTVNVLTDLQANLEAAGNPLEAEIELMAQRLSEISREIASRPSYH